MQDTKDPSSTVQYVTMYGRDLRVVHSAGIAYVDPRPLCVMGGINWAVFQDSLVVGDGPVIYGTKMLSSPNVPFDERPKGSDKPSPFIRLDRLKFFLIRLDTEKMRWHKSVREADALLLDQERWAEELNQVDQFVPRDGSQ